MHKVVILTAGFGNGHNAAAFNIRDALEEVSEEVHSQGGLAVASHPHETKSTWGRNTLYLWEQQEEFAPLLDAWEIANRDDLFNPVGLKRLPFLANSDFHKPSHIYSWKTLLYCEKHPDAIKQCVRENRNLSITLYRDPLMADESNASLWMGPPLSQLLPPLRGDRLEPASA